MCLQKVNSMTRPRRLLSSISLSIRRAAQIESNTLSSTLPEALDVLLPACSKDCVRAFIADSFPSSSFTDIHTLCTSKTASGFTLGEAALVCETAYCAADGQVDKSIFSICASVPQAIRPSHESLTVVPMATSQLTPGSNAFSSALPPTIGAPATTSVDATKITSATGAPSPPSPSAPAPAPSTLSTFSSSSSSSTETHSASTSTSTSSSTIRPGESDANVTSSSSPTASPAAVQAQENLSTGQIVGISLAALAIFGFVVGLLLFLYYRRKERSRHRRGSRWSDGIEKQPPVPPADHHLEAGFSNPRAATPDHSQRFYAPPTVAQEKRRSFWRRSIKPEDIGVAVTPEVVQAGSPTSISSQRTISQLLPELPNYSLWPAPLRKSQQILVTPERRREPSRPTVTFPSTFVENRKGQKSPRIVSSRTGNGLPTDPRARMYRLEQEKGANSKIPLTPVYDNGNVRTNFGATLASKESVLLHPGNSTQFQSQRTYDPRLQTQAIFQAPVNRQKPSLPPSPPAHFQITRPRQAPPARRNSSASDSTTFEDDEDTTPEQENDKQLRPTPLSPVPESPRNIPDSPIERLTTPLKGLTYPSPPRSAAISKQAEKRPRPRAAQFVDTSRPTSSPLRNPPSTAPSRRDQLVLDEASFFSTASSSSPSRKRDESPSSLLSKRKGDKAADQMLQRGLRLSSAAANAPAVNKWRVSSGQNEGRGREGSDTENNVNVILKTPPPKDLGGGGLKSPPVWTPRLTPTRRGEDLYLRVE